MGKEWGATLLVGIVAFVAIAGMLWTNTYSAATTISGNAALTGMPTAELLPNLMVVGLGNSPSSPLAGSAVLIRFLIINTGNVETIVSPELDDGDADTRESVEVRSRIPVCDDVEILAPRRACWVQYRVTYATPGVKTVVASVDLEEAVTELRETDNTRTKRITVRAANNQDSPPPNCVAAGGTPTGTQACCPQFTQTNGVCTVPSGCIVAGAVRTAERTCCSGVNAAVGSICPNNPLPCVAAGVVPGEGRTCCQGTPASAGSSCPTTPVCGGAGQITCTTGPTSCTSPLMASAGRCCSVGMSWNGNACVVTIACAGVGSRPAAGGSCCNGLSQQTDGTCYDAYAATMQSRIDMITGSGPITYPIGSNPTQSPKSGDGYVKGPGGCWAGMIEDTSRTSTAKPVCRWPCAAGNRLSNGLCPLSTTANLPRALDSDLQRSSSRNAILSQTYDFVWPGIYGSGTSGGLPTNAGWPFFNIAVARGLVPPTPEGLETFVAWLSEAGGLDPANPSQRNPATLTLARKEALQKIVVDGTCEYESNMQSKLANIPDCNAIRNGAATASNYQYLFSSIITNAGSTTVNARINQAIFSGSWTMVYTPVVSVSGPTNNLVLPPGTNTITLSANAAKGTIQSVGDMQVSAGSAQGMTCQYRVENRAIGDGTGSQGLPAPLFTTSGVWTNTVKQNDIHTITLTNLATTGGIYSLVVGWRCSDDGEVTFAEGAPYAVIVSRQQDVNGMQVRDLTGPGSASNSAQPYSWGTVRLSSSAGTLSRVTATWAQSWYPVLASAPGSGGPAYFQLARVIRPSWSGIPAAPPWGAIFNVQVPGTFTKRAADDWYNNQNGVPVSWSGVPLIELCYTQPDVDAGVAYLKTKSGASNGPAASDRWNSVLQDPRLATIAEVCCTITSDSTRYNCETPINRCLSTLNNGVTSRNSEIANRVGFTAIC